MAGDFLIAAVREAQDRALADKNVSDPEVLIWVCCSLINADFLVGGMRVRHPAIQRRIAGCAAHSSRDAILAEGSTPQAREVPPGAAPYASPKDAGWRAVVMAV